MSPEYLRTGACDTASDVFSLACTLVFAATGSAPFGDGTGVDVMHRVAFEEPNPKVLAEIAAADAALASLLTACLAKEPGQRPTPGRLIETAEAGFRESGTTASGSPGPEAAGPSESSDWPEPLGGRVLARQRAYETLCRLPLEQPAPEPLVGASAPAAADAPPSPSSRRTGPGTTSYAAPHPNPP